MVSREILPVINRLLEAMEKLMPEGMKVPSDQGNSNEIVAACVMDGSGRVHGKFFRTKGSGFRKSYHGVKSNDSELWFAGAEMGRYGLTVFNKEVDEIENVLGTLDLVGREAYDIKPKRVIHKRADEEFMKKVLKSVEENISNAGYSVEDLGRDIAMSRMQLYRKLKTLTNQSANEFIRSIRLKRAAQLLKENQLTIAEITYDVGFNDLPYFRECFKRMFGVTPSEYSQR